MIHILSSDASRHIRGNKELTDHAEIIRLQPDKVYIPAFDNKGMALDGLIGVGQSVLKGTKLGVRKDFDLTVYSPVSGKVTGLVNKRSIQLNRNANYIEIENDKQSKRELLKPLSEKPTKEEIISKLKEGSIVGLGGAGFPSYIKYGTKDKIDTLVVNAVECEPYITTDFVVGTRDDMTDTFRAISLILDAFAIPKCIIGLKKERKELVEALKKDLAVYPDKRISLGLVKSVYPAGMERSLIQMLLGRKYNKLPSEAHVITNNIQTISCMARLFFSGEIIADRLITVSGLVNKPANIYVPYGALVKDLIAACEGYKTNKAVVISGGPMMGTALPNDDMPLPIQANAITVLEQKAYRVQPCIRCGCCTASCPINLQPCEINFASQRGDYERCFDLNVMECISCGLCSYVCPSHIDVFGGVDKAKLVTKLKVSRAHPPVKPIAKVADNATGDKK